MVTELNFSISQLIVDNRVVSVDDFDLIDDEILDKKTITFRNEEDNKKEEDIFSIQKIIKTTKEGRFICIYFEEGDKYPYSDIVIDDHLQESKNPRSINEIELSNQFFVMIDCSNSRIFISDYRKKLLLLEWIKDKINKKVFMKPIMVEKDFLDKIKRVKEISFTVEPNLFNSYNKGTFSTTLADDIFGFGASSANIKMFYKNTDISKTILQKMSSLIERKNDFKNITIIGRTADTFESIFNMNEVVSKVNISVDTSKINRKLNYETVFDLLIAKIKQ
jgi:hypothetical protein